MSQAIPPARDTLNAADLWTSTKHGPTCSERHSGCIERIETFESVQHRAFCQAAAGGPSATVSVCSRRKTPRRSRPIC